jgi:O-antigen ligase
MAFRSKSNRAWSAQARPYWALVIFLLLVFLIGGGARADINSLVILRPAAVIFCGIGLWSLKRQHFEVHRFLFYLAIGIFVLVGSHLIPLPPLIWGALPGRELMTEIDRSAGLGSVWRPISMVPSTTWNALYSLFIPLAVLLLGAQLHREQRYMLLPWLLGLGMLSGFLGLLQSIGDPQGALYFYKITNNGAAVGLFANRNHQAIFLACLFPLLAVFASSGIKSEQQAQLRSWIALAGTVVLVPLLLVTGSRAGLIAGFLGLTSIALLYRKPSMSTPKKRKGNKLDLRWLFAVFGVVFLGGLTVLFSRAEALQRITEAGQLDELRFRSWPSIIEMAWKYFPIGSGIGSFVEVYQIDEPLELLQPSYLNHAHNDWLELYLTSGLLGLVGLVVAIAAWLRMTRKSLRAPLGDGRETLFMRLGAVILFILALGSLADYPLRVPSMMCLLVIAALWLGGNPDQSPKNGGSL